MKAILALALQTRLCAWRRPSFLLLLATPLGAAPVCAAWSGDAFSRWYPGLVSFCLTLTAIILAVETLSGERLDGSSILWLASPLEPWRCLSGKWLGIISLNGMVVLACLALSLGYGAAPPEIMLPALFLAWLRSGLAAAAALAAGSFLKPAGCAFFAVLLESGGYLHGLLRRLNQMDGLSSALLTPLRLFPDNSLYDWECFSPLATFADALPRCLIPLLLGALILAGKSGRNG